jgi:hypothetical protein
MTYICTLTMEAQGRYVSELHRVSLQQERRSPQGREEF